MLGRNELYARYLTGHAQGKARRPRPTPEAEASMQDWALELGYLDGLGDRSVRSQDELAVWCLCCLAYQHGVAGSVCDPVCEQCGLQGDAPRAASALDLGAHLGARDALSGRVRTPVDLAELMRSLGS